MSIRLTRHSISRGYDRLSIDSDQLLEMATEAYHQGVYKEIKLRNIIRKKLKPSHTPRVYNDKLWIFDGNRLVTFYEIHPKLRFKITQTKKNIKDMKEIKDYKLIPDIVDGVEIYIVEGQYNGVDIKMKIDAKVIGANHDAYLRRSLIKNKLEEYIYDQVIIKVKSDYEKKYGK